MTGGKWSPDTEEHRLPGAALPPIRFPPPTGDAQEPADLTPGAPQPGGLPHQVQSGSDQDHPGHGGQLSPENALHATAAEYLWGEASPVALQPRLCPLRLGPAHRAALLSALAPSPGLFGWLHSTRALELDEGLARLILMSVLTS